MVKPYSTRSMAGRPPASTAQLVGEIATTRDGRDITRGYVSGLQQPRDPRLLGSVDWGIYDQILMDDQVFSTLQQRRLAVVSRGWTVLPGDEEDPRSVEAADRFNDTLTRLGWDRITDKMLYAIFYGFAVAELIWEPRAGLLDFGQIRIRHARRFRFDADGVLRLLQPASPAGLPLPDRKFWTLALGGSDDDEFYGRGLAEWLYWPTLFKRNGVRFWNTFLDKFGSPTAVGKFRPGTSRADINNLLGALAALATDTGIAIPEGMTIDLLQAARSGTADYATLVERMDGAIAKIILSQTMTTQDGSSLSQAQVHAGVKLEVIKADADLLSDSFNAGPARWWTDVNYGPDVASPKVMRDVEEEADTKAQADTDAVLKSLGWERDDESFADTYGDGYVRTTAPQPPAKSPRTAMPPASADRADGADPAQSDPAQSDPAQSDPAQLDARSQSFAADDLRPLYVYRRLLNADDVIAWARSQGFTGTLRADDMHVTIAYSRRPVNWMKMGGYWSWTADNDRHTVPPGGPRLVEAIGNDPQKPAVALFFFSGHLDQRNREMRDAGASWDHDNYLPHVTITYDGAPQDLSAVEPYRGELRFGPEIFEPIVENWQETIRHASFAAPSDPVSGDTGWKTLAQAVAAGETTDKTDLLIDQLIAESGYAATTALTDPMLAAIKQANSPEELIALLGQSPGDETRFAATLENASFALRLDAESGGTING